MTKQSRYSPEFRERAVRMLLDQQGEHESQWAAMNSIAAKLGCTSETLRKWVRQSEKDLGLRDGVTSDERERLKTLEGHRYRMSSSRVTVTYETVCDYAHTAVRGERA